LKGTLLKNIKEILKIIGINFTRKGLLKKLPLISIPINTMMNYADIKIIGKTSKAILETLYGMCKNCGHKMPEIGKFCAICGHAQK